MLKVSSEYFTVFQFQGMSPVPAQETADETFTYWTFTAPPGPDLVVQLDHVVKPASWGGATGTVTAIVDGRERTTLEFTTTLMP